VRERDADDEFVRVVLPKTPAGNDGKRRAVAIRIPERGAFAEDERLPRGMLILTVVGDKTSDDRVRRVHPSLAPSPVELIEGPAPSSRVPVRPEASAVSWPLVVVVAIVVWILLLVVLRANGAF
jgi:hypothetical protein